MQYGPNYLQTPFYVQQDKEKQETKPIRMRKVQLPKEKWDLKQWQPTKKNLRDWNVAQEKKQKKAEEQVSQEPSSDEASAQSGPVQLPAVDGFGPKGHQEAYVHPGYLAAPGYFTAQRYFVPPGYVAAPPGFSAVPLSDGSRNWYMTIPRLVEGQNSEVSSVMQSQNDHLGKAQKDQLSRTQGLLPNEFAIEAHQYLSSHLSQVQWTLENESKGSSVNPNEGPVKTHGTPTKEVVKVEDLFNQIEALDKESLLDFSPETLKSWLTAFDSPKKSGTPVVSPKKHEFELKMKELEQERDYWKKMYFELLSSQITQGATFEQTTIMKTFGAEFSPSKSPALLSTTEVNSKRTVAKRLDYGF